MLDHTKTLKQEGENGSLRNAAMSAFEEGAPFMGTALAAHKQPQWPGCFCKKMCCPNGSRKLHFVQKIHPAPKHSLYGHALFSARSAIFCDLLEVTIFRLLARLLMPVPLPFSPSLSFYIEAIKLYGFIGFNGF